MKVEIAVILEMIVSVILVLLILPQKSQLSKNHLTDLDEEVAFKPKGKEAFLNKYTKVFVFLIFVINVVGLVLYK